MKKFCVKAHTSQSKARSRENMFWHVEVALDSSVRQRSPRICCNNSSIQDTFLNHIRQLSMSFQ